MTATHSKLPPSSAARRMACPGSRAMEEKYGRNEESEASKEGTLAHEVAANYVSREKFIGLSPVFTDEMHEGGQLYAQVVQNVCQNQRSSSLVTESKIEIKNVHPEMWGTPDAVLINFGESRLPKELHVFDYKFGFTPVEAYENWQLLAYACGIIATNPQITNIYLHIIQPRDYLSSSKHKVWKLTAEELEGYRKRLQISEMLSMSPSAELKVSEQCKYCPARHACPALQQASFGAAEMSFRDTPRGLEPEYVGNELKLLHEARDILEFRITALETEAQHHLQAGKQVPNYHLKAIEGRMNWKIDKSAIINLGLLHGTDLRKEDTLTPTQAIKAGVPEKEIVKCSERKQSIKLSKIDLTESAKIFGNQQ